VFYDLIRLSLLACGAVSVNCYFVGNFRILFKRYCKWDCWLNSTVCF